MSALILIAVLLLAYSNGANDNFKGDFHDLARLGEGVAARGTVRGIGVQAAAGRGLRGRHAGWR